MLATKIACPRCSRNFKTPRPVGVGKHLRCSRCDTPFTVSLEDMLDPLPTSDSLPPAPDSLSELTLPEDGGGTGVHLPSAAVAVAPSPPTPHPVATSGSLVSPPLARLPSEPLVATGERGERLATAVPVAAPQAIPVPAATPQDAGDRPAPRLLLPALIVVGLLVVTGLAVYLTLTLGSGPTNPDPSERPGAASAYNPQADNQPRPGLPAHPVSTATPDEHPDPPQPLVKLPPEEQARVDRAIEHGLAYLRKQQHASGTWSPRAYAVGYAALPGLTLLECGAAATDPQVQKAARFVRDAVPNLNTTYEIGLAILFLDRLGDRKDEAVIRTLALRLIAGQTPGGGWTYHCPLISAEHERTFLTLLRETRPRVLGDLLVAGPDGKKPDWVPPSLASQPLPPLVRTKPDGTPPGRPQGVMDLPPPRPVRPQELLASLPLQLQTVPALRKPKEGDRFPTFDGTDNSNSQFAILGLWAAGRHDVPMERTLARLVTRLRSSQGPDGNWGYSYRAGGSPGNPAMTNAGLLGLAVGHGLTTATGKEKDRRKVEDGAIEKGLKALAANIGKPLGKRPERGKRQADINLYFLWSLERVAVLYNLPTIDDRDWYGWGAELLVDAQKPQGHWQTGTYFGSTPVLDTSLALLFLKRANLAPDLTRKLQVLTRIR